MRVLIVDDSEPMRRYARRIAELSGLEIDSYLEARDGGEALRSLRENPVDVVLTDINMPVLSGQDLINEMMRDADLRRIPVVVISTDRTRSRVRDLVTSGAIGYVEKPFSPERLGAELNRARRVAAEIVALDAAAS